VIAQSVKLMKFLKGAKWFIIIVYQSRYSNDWFNLIACVPFFFKQWGGTRKKKAGRLLEGGTWDEVPVVSHVG